MVGTDTFRLAQECERLDDNPPVIVHFASHDKPWNTYSISRLRELWWAYRDLDWSEMISGKANLNYFDRSNQSKKNVFIVTWVLEVEHFERSNQSQKQAMVVTWSADIKHLEYLLQQLPDWHFHVAAPVYCNKDLTKLSVYSNVTLYQSILHQRIDWLLDDSSVYLDINTGGEVLNVVTRAQDRGKKIFAFDSTRKSMDDGIYDGVFCVDKPEALVNAIKKLEE